MVAPSTLAWRLPTRTRASLKITGGLVGLISSSAPGRADEPGARRNSGLGVTSVSFLGVFAAVVGWLAISLLLPRAPVRPGCPGARRGAGGGDVGGDAGGEPGLPPEPDRACERPLRSRRRDDRDPRLVLHRRAGDGRLDVPRCGRPRALRHDLTAALLTADPARPGPPLGLAPGDSSGSTSRPCPTPNPARAGRPVRAPRRGAARPST